MIAAKNLDPDCPNCHGGRDFYASVKGTCPVCKGKFRKPDCPTEEPIEVKLNTLRGLLRLYSQQRVWCDPMRFVNIQRMQQLLTDIQKLEALECQKKE